MRKLLLGLPVLLFAVIAASCDETYKMSLPSMHPEPADPGYVGTRPDTTMTTIYSSNARNFGMPALASSADALHVLTYDGVQDVQADQRRRTWIRQDAQTGVLSSGSVMSPLPAMPIMRDQEIAARGSVLAAIYTAGDVLVGDVSMDGGNTFPVRSVLANVRNEVGESNRFLAVAVGADYRVSFVFWVARGVGNNQVVSELTLVEAVPSSTLPGGAPSAYTVTPRSVVFSVPVSISAMVMHAEYSASADLMIGFGFSGWLPVPGEDKVVDTRAYRFAVRMNGQTSFLQTAVEISEGQVVDVPQPPRPAGSDPHVAVLGSGPTMKIFYAYDTPQGVRLQYSQDAGQTFQSVLLTSSAGAYFPSVHPRYVGAALRVDLLYLKVRPGTGGMVELHGFLWRDFKIDLLPEPYSLTVGKSSPAKPGPGYMVNMVSAFGYDAEMHNGALAVVAHEFSCNNINLWAQWEVQPANIPVFVGYPNLMVAPDSGHRNQLRLFRLE